MSLPRFFSLTPRTAATLCALSVCLLALTSFVRAQSALSSDAMLSAAPTVHLTPITEPLRPSFLGRGPDGWRHMELGAVRGATIGPIEDRNDDGTRGYGSPTTERVLDDLVAQGFTWVSVTPFGRMWDLASTEIDMNFETPFSFNQHKITTFVAQAHAHGLRVMLVPHLWIVSGGWRGEIDPGSATRWAQWFQSYTHFVLAWADVANQANVDMLSVGAEMKSSSGRMGTSWFTLIHEVRAHFPGMLTYSANWDEESQVLFWDRLDITGINAFYPLTDKPGATLDELRRGANAHAERIERWALREGRSVLFTEFGYTATPNPALHPWEWPDKMAHTPVDAHAQALAYRALLEAFAPRSWFAGGFVWRYSADPMDAKQEPMWGFSPRGREAERVLREIFALGWGADGLITSARWRTLW